MREGRRRGIGGLLGAALAITAAVVVGRLFLRPAEADRGPLFREALAIYASGLDSLDAALRSLEAAVPVEGVGPAVEGADPAAGNGADPAATERVNPAATEGVSPAAVDTAGLRTRFRRARAAYKRVEMFAHYYTPEVARDLNAPPLPRTEDEDPATPLPPIGFQVVEELLYPEIAPESGPRMLEQVRGIEVGAGLLRRAPADTLLGDPHVFDAARLEVARVATLSLAGFDATLSGDGVVESAEAIEGMREVLRPYLERLRRRAPSTSARLEAAFDAAVTYLRANPDFQDFDRFAYIVTRANPLAHALAEAQAALGIPVPDVPRAWSTRAASIFDAGAFDPAFFAPPDTPESTPALVSLGEALFDEHALSPAGRSCTSCHVPEHAFTDGLPVTATLGSHPDFTARNTPTLVNAGLQPALFFDGRVRYLESQAAAVLASPAEMGGSLEGAAAAIHDRPKYVRRFALAFDADPDSAVNGRTLRLALAAYVRSLVALDSRFDRAIRGDTTAFTAEERHGFNLFMGKAGCGTCHFAPLFNGATPPTLVEAEPEVIGVPGRAVTQDGVIDADVGRYALRHVVQHRHAFRTPTLRNIALTAPYMHNGAYATLEDVVDFYDRGGGAGIGITLPNQTLPAEPLGLSDGEKHALVAFLRTLTDTTSLASPVS